MVEKPALIDRKDYLEILDLSKENICVGMVERYNDKLHYLRTIERDKLKNIKIHRICAFPSDNNIDNLIYDLAIHDIDFLFYTFGEIEIKSIIKKNNECVIYGNIKKINIEINVGYTTDSFKREYS